VARIAVGIAAGDHADAQRRVGDEAGAVADGVAGLQLLHADDAAGQRHGRLQLPVRDVVLGKVGRAAVDRDAGRTQSARTWASLRGAARGAVGQRALAGQVARGLLERLQLVAMPRGPSAVAEVRHQRDLVDLRQRVQPRQAVR
jgi:hypothetical protein